MHRYERKLGSHFHLKTISMSSTLLQSSSQSAQASGCYMLDLKLYLGRIETKLA